MAFTISSLNKEKTFTEKEVVNIGSAPSCDYVINTGFDFLLTVQYSASENKCVVINSFNNPNFLFKGQSIGAKLEVDNMCKLMINGSDEFLSVKILAFEPVQKTVSSIGATDFTEADMKGLYGEDVNATTRIKIEKKKSDIEQARVAIIKQVSYQINDLKGKISANYKTTVFLHVAMFFASLVCAFGLGNYLMGLKITDSGNILHLSTNLQLLFVYAAIIFGAALVLKQGVFLFLQNKISTEASASSVIAEKFTIFMSAIFMLAIYLINMLYYMSGGIVVFAILMSLFFVITLCVLAIGAGYFKSNNVENTMKLDKFEYREDFERVIKEYQQWIECFINNLSGTKIRNIKDKLFSLQIKSVGETIIGILTAPFLAYGVSNTLAMCFPEAAGWIRISGLRFSPVFLVLATFLIVFAFFAFVNAFYCMRKIDGANVLKQDGFSNYINHGVDILGLEAVKRLKSEIAKSLTIGIGIILIEFSMNVSFFAGEIGGDLGGLLLSLVAALVPTALLIAETYMLSQTKFYAYACEELIAKIDRD